MNRGAAWLPAGLTVGLCALVWLVGTLTPAGLALAHGSPSAPVGGINVNSGYLPVEADRDIAEAKALHAKVIRVDAPWSVLEPSGPQVDQNALAFLDRLTADGSSSGIRIILDAFNTPCWASSAPASLLGECVSSKKSKANAWPPREPGAFATFVAFLAQRYGTELAAIEIWNEPDQANQFYLAGPSKAARYAEILRAAYPAIKRVNPNTTVLAGSLVGSNGAFLRALYAAGIKGYYDGLAVHFYNLVLGSLRSIHETQVANGDNTPLWLDEFGWSSCYPRQHIEQEQACVTPQVQAQNITNTFRSLARTPYIAAELPYQLRSSSREEFGMLSASGVRKPAFAALSRALVSPLQNPSPVKLKLTIRGNRVLASGSGPVGDYMKLEVFSGAVSRYRSLFTLDRFNRYSIRLPAVLGTHRLRVRVFQYWAGASKAATASIR